MRALRGWRPPAIVVRAGIGIVMAAALSIAVVAETTVASSAGRSHGRSSEHKSHRQRVNHFNVGATHSPKLLRQLHGRLHGHDGAPNNGPLLGSGHPAALQGVDVASYQHPNGERINWARVAKSGVQFAAIKATEGTYYRNPFALTDLAQAKAAGLSVVAYVFAVPNGNGGSGSATAQADYLVTDLAKARGRMPPIMLDIEYNPYGDQCYGLSQSAMRSWIAQFSREVQAKTGQGPIIYGPGPWWQDCTGGTSRFGQFPLWVPDWTTAPRPTLPRGWSNYAFWQYSSAGTVRGIDAAGNTDLDQVNPAVVSLLDPGPQRSVAGAAVDLQLRLADKGAVRDVSYSAAGLPPGTSISATGQITGWPVATGTYNATVSASTPAGQSGSVSFGWAVSPGPSVGAAGLVQLERGGLCLTAADDALASGTPAVIKACTGTSAQTWTYAQDDTLRINNQCLTIPTAAQGTVVELQPCASSRSQQWHLVYPRGVNPAVGSHPTTLINPWSGMCLADPGFSRTDGTQVELWPCDGYANQAWSLPAGPMASQIPGMCLDDSGNVSANNTKIDIWPCNGTPAQAWLVQSDGTVRINGKCLDVQHGAKASGSPVDLFSCNGTQAQQWRLMPAGLGITLVNPESGLCLADPDDSTDAGTQLVIATCTAGDPGMSWRPF
jgi:GH25 family lysozyme M1 (1,4-beta-N-acetylmuramidase)